MLEAFTLKEEAVRVEEERLRELVRQLPDEQRAEHFRQYNKTLKDPDTYATLNWFFMAGLHHFYLGKIGRGLFDLVLMVAGITFLFILPPLGLLLILIVVIIELPALFRSQVIVADYNNRVAEQLLANRRPGAHPR